jgi:hypothetical protein
MAVTAPATILLVNVGLGATTSRPCDASQRIKRRSNGKPVGNQCPIQKYRSIARYAGDRSFTCAPKITHTSTGAFVMAQSSCRQTAGFANKQIESAHGIAL